MRKSTQLFLIFSVLIIATFLRLYQIKTIPPGLYPDEAMNGNNALEAVRTGNYKFFYPENNGREGLFINIQALFLKLLGATLANFSPQSWMLRLPSALFGILTVLGLYFFVKELFSSKSNTTSEKNISLALLAAFFLATSFWHINFSRIGFRAILAPFFLIWALYLLLKAFHSEKPWQFCLISTIAGFFFGLGFHTYIAYRVTPLIVLLIFLHFYFRSRRDRWSKKFKLISAGFLLSTLVAVFPLGLYFVKNPQDFFGRTSQISVFNSEKPVKDLISNILKTAAMFNIQGDSNWRHNYASKPQLFWPVGVLFLIGFFVSIKKTAKFFFETIKCKVSKNLSINASGEDSSFPFLILLFLFISAATPVVISNEGIPHALRSILMLPPAIIFAALGATSIYQKFSTTKSSGLAGALKTFALFLFFFSLIIHSYFTYFVFWANNQNTSWAFNQDSLILGEKLNSLPKNIQKYVIVAAPGVEIPIVDGLSGKTKLIPMPAQTVIFITNTYSAENQRAKNIYYLLPEEEKNLPADAMKFYIK